MYYKRKLNCYNFTLYDIGVLRMAKGADGQSTNIPIAVPQHWTPVLRNAKKTGKPFIVNEVATEEVVDLKQLEADMQVNFKINSDKEKVLWTEMKVIRIVKGESKLKYKTDHRAEEFKEICFERPPSKKLSPAYKKPPKIPAAKAKDLCQNNIIPKTSKGRDL
ncbi:hypothetical protein GE061_007988 [Apolygus lucorum]|uniref:Uncharacterized protein n=1 Tax=Apolygus lucorum TaxID=248454 RepID=A0A8S9WQ25_APOLU|nr:hypothetical protein GE061_007988 [Apolygus lucorum]